MGEAGEAAEAGETKDRGMRPADSVERTQASGDPGPCPHIRACPSVGGAGAGISEGGVPSDLSGLLHSWGGSSPGIMG